MEFWSFRTIHSWKSLVGATNRLSGKNSGSLIIYYNYDGNICMQSSRGGGNDQFGH